MTVNTVEIRKTYNGNGVTDAFATPYFLADADLAVYVGGVLQTITTDYTVAGAGVPAGGTVTFVTPPPTGTANVVIIRDPALTQLTDWVENDDNGAEVKETAFDKLTMIAQRQQDKIDRSLRLQDFDLDVDMELPLKSTRVNKFLAFNSDGEPVASAFGSIGDAQVFSNKAAAVAYIDVNGITNGQAYFITSDDGGTFTGVTGASAATYADDSTSYCGTQFIPTGGDGSSALLRDSYGDGVVWGQWFGAKYDGTTDDTTAIDDAAQSLTSGGVVMHPEGTARLTALTLYTKVVHEGQGTNSTALQVLSSASSFITMPSGPNVSSGFRNIGISGGTSFGVALNSGQWAFTLQAVADASTTGGWWFGVMDNVYVYNFDNCMDLDAGDNFLLPHQFHAWHNVRFIRNNTATGRCLKAQKQVEQIHFDRCSFDAIAGTSTGKNIELVAGSSTRPDTWTGTRCSIQNSDYGIDSAGSTDIRMEAWFENLKKAVTLSGTNTNFNFSGRFANAANDSGSGYILSAIGTGNVKLSASTMAGTTDKIVATASSVYVDTSGIAQSSSATTVSTGMTKQISESSNTLTCGMGKTFLVNTTVNNITTINSDLMPGESLYLRALGGTFPLATGGNIQLGTAASPLTILQNEVVQLIRYDSTGPWICVGK